MYILSYTISIASCHIWIAFEDAASCMLLGFVRQPFIPFLD